MEADYPASWQADHAGEADPLTTEIVSDVAQVLSPAPGGGKSVIIPGGETEQFTAPPAVTGEADVRPSAEAYLIDTLLYGADTLVMTMDRVPGAPPPSLTRTERAIKAVLGSADCASQADRLVQDKVTSAGAAGQLFRDDVDWAVGCLGEQWKAAYGLSGFTGAFVVQVILWLVDGIRLVVDGVRALIDSIVYWRTYRIVIGSTGLAGFQGSWYVHDGSLCVGEALQLPAGNTFPPCQGNGNTGWQREWYGCNPIPPATVPVCNEWDEIAFTAEPGGTIIGTVTKVLGTTNDSTVIVGPAPATGYLQPGDTFQLTREATGLLKTTYLRTHLSQDNLQYGNPYWCGPGISAANQSKCGA